MSDRRKILLISGFLPSRRVPSGGQKIVFQVIEELTKDNDVTLLGFCNEREAQHLDYSDFGKCVQAKIFKISTATRAYAVLRYPNLPLITSARFALAHQWLRQALARDSYDFAWLEFIQGASLLPLIPSAVRTRLVVHDLFHQAHERKAARTTNPLKAFWNWEAARTKRWESQAISRASEVITLTDKDRLIAQSISGRTDITVRYPEVDSLYHEVGKIRGARILKGTILFWGQMSRAENEDAVLWFVRDILPSIRRRRPNTKLVIAGANPKPSVQRLASPYIEVTGFVADPVSLFETAEIAIAPLRLGAGIKIKVAEYIAGGIPTVATSVGAEGIKYSQLLHIAENADSFGDACVELMSLP